MPFTSQQSGETHPKKFYDELASYALCAIAHDSPWVQAIRLPFQAVLIAWAWWYTKPSDKEKQASIIPKSLIPQELEW